MEFIFIFPVGFFKIVSLHLFQIVEIVRAFRIDAFMENEVFAFFLCHKCFPTMRTAQSELPGEAVLLWRKVGVTYFALDLSSFPIVAVEVGLGGIAGRTATVIWDVTGFAPGNRFDLFSIAELKVRGQELPVPLMLMELDSGEFINLELLIFWGMGIIKRPLFERDISADKVD